MARIAGVDIPSDKRVVIALTYVYGIGNTLSKEMNFQIMNDFKENIYDNFYGTYYGQLGLKVEPDKLTYLTNLSSKPPIFFSS